MQYGCIRLCRLILQMWICVKLMVSDCLFTYLLYSLHPWYVHAVKHRWHRSNMLIYHIHVITLDCAAICVCSHRFCVLYFAAVCIFRALKSLWFELGKQYFETRNWEVIYDDSKECDISFLRICWLSSKELQKIEFNCAKHFYIIGGKGKDLKGTQPGDFNLKVSRGTELMMDYQSDCFMWRWSKVSTHHKPSITHLSSGVSLIIVAVNNGRVLLRRTHTETCHSHIQPVQKSHSCWMKIFNWYFNIRFKAVRFGFLDSELNI